MSVALQSTEIANLQAATTPEEAAQIFLDAVSRGLASVIAQSLDDTLKESISHTAVNTNIDGWNTYIKGCSIDLCWERPKLGLPVGQIVSFAARNTDGVTPLAGNVSVGISISASF